MAAALALQAVSPICATLPLLQQPPVAALVCCPHRSTRRHRSIYNTLPTVQALACAHRSHYNCPHCCSTAHKHRQSSTYNLEFSKRPCGEHSSFLLTISLVPSKTPRSRVSVPQSYLGLLSTDYPSPSAPGRSFYSHLSSSIYGLGCITSTAAGDHT